MQQFSPVQFVKLTAGASSAVEALPTTVVGSKAAEITVTTGDGIFVKFGRSTDAAAEPGADFAEAGGMPVLVGQSKLIALPPWATHLVFIRSGAADSDFYVALGNAIP